MPLEAQFKKVDITPAEPVSLAGYFNQRISEGVLDPLFLRLGLLRGGGTTLLFVQVDTCAILVEDVEDMRQKISEAAGVPPSNIMIFASHVHNAPDLVGFFGLPRENGYLVTLKDRVAREAASLTAPRQVRMRLGKIAYEGLSYNRRWYLKDGRVATNPPKCDPSLDHPEGAVDREAGIIGFQDAQGSWAAIFVNISNHTDTVGGSLISADWPAVMEARIGERLGKDLIVFPFIAPQGNINHFVFDDPKSQFDPAERIRIGRSYGDMVGEALASLRPADFEFPEARFSWLDIPPRDVSEGDIRSARETLARTSEAKAEDLENLTAGDLLKGVPIVDRIFAECLLRFVAERPQVYRVPLQVLRLGPAAIAAIPGEPFVEIGLALKKTPGYDVIFPTALANGYLSYIPLPESFERGGYEIRAGASNRLCRDASVRILKAFGTLLKA